jgi:hypothetical protein
MHTVMDALTLMNNENEYVMYVPIGIHGWMNDNCEIVTHCHSVRDIYERHSPQNAQGLAL